MRVFMILFLRKWEFFFFGTKEGQSPKRKKTKKLNGRT